MDLERFLIEQRLLAPAFELMEGEEDVADEADSTRLFPSTRKTMKPDKDKVFSRYKVLIDKDRDERRALYHGGPQKIRNQADSGRDNFGEGIAALDQAIEDYRP